MSVSHQINYSVSSSTGVVSLNGYDNETGATEIILNSTFPASSSLTAFTLALTAANLQDVFIWSDKGGTIKTNGSGADVQTFTPSGTVSGGSWSVAFGGQTTVFQYNDSAATIQTGLRALSSIGSGNITCTGGPMNTTPVVCTFAGTLATGKQTLMAIYSGAITGGGSIGVTHTTLGLPSDTIVLQPGIPLVWGTSTGYGSNPFTSNVTSATFSCTPASRLQGRILSA